MEFLFPEKGKEDEFFTRSVESKIFIYITPEGKIAKYSTGVNEGYISFTETLNSSQTSFTKVCFLYKLKGFGREL